MKLPCTFLRLVWASAAGLLVAGCLFRPATSSVRRFVLSPLPPPERAPAPTEPLTLGIGRVSMPPYLLRSALALRKGGNEIQYDEDALWAEPLDQGFQRTLAANLSRLLPTEQIFLSAWEHGQVKIRVSVNIDQFDVDSHGRGRLTAWWQLTRPGRADSTRSGKVDLVRTGAAPQNHPQALVATLSELTAEFSRRLTLEIRDFAREEVTGP